MMDPKEVEAINAPARIHLAFVAELCEEQIKNRRYIVHEHPSGALSWKEDPILRILSMPGVERVDCDQC